MKVRHIYDWQDRLDKQTLSGQPVVFKQKVPVATLVQTNDGNIGVSVCSEKDNFNKALGRQIALGRSRLGIGPRTATNGWHNRVIRDAYGNEVRLGEFIDTQVEALVDSFNQEAVS